MSVNIECTLYFEPCAIRLRLQFSNRKGETQLRKCLVEFLWYSKMPETGLLSVYWFSWVCNLYFIYFLLENHVCQPDHVNSYPYYIYIYAKIALMGYDWFYNNVDKPTWEFGPPSLGFTISMWHQRTRPSMEICGMKPRNRTVFGDNTGVFSACG